MLGTTLKANVGSDRSEEKVVEENEILSKYLKYLEKITVKLFIDVS